MPLIRSTNLRWLQVASLPVLMLWLLSSCAFAPGMKYDPGAPEGNKVDTTGTFSGLTVELQSLTPRQAMLSNLRGDSIRRATLPEEIRAYKPGSYRLGKFDVLAIAIWEHPELTMPFGEYRTDDAAGHMIDDSGSFFFPYAGTIRAEGMTTTELREKLAARLSRVLNNPQINVKVTGFRSQHAYVNGAVGRPGKIALTNSPLSIIDAINQAGGLQGNSDPGHIELLRDGQTYVLDLSESSVGGIPTSGLWLKNFDVLRIPSTDESKVYVLGEVRDPQAVSFSTGKISLVHALMRAGGINNLTAQAKAIYVIRGENISRIKVWHLDARNPLSLAMADRFQLQPKDVIYVDATGLVSWNRVISLIAPTVDLLGNGIISTNTIKTISNQ